MMKIINKNKIVIRTYGNLTKYIILLINKLYNPRTNCKNGKQSVFLLCFILITYLSYNYYYFNLY